MSLRRLDWSLLDRLQSNSTGTRPRVDLHITGEIRIGPIGIFLMINPPFFVLLDR